MRFRSYVDGGERFLGPETLDGGPGRAGLGHRARVRRVHAVSRRPRVHRALDGAHPPLARALPALARRARARRPGRLRDRPGRRRRGSARRVAATVAASGCDGVAIGGSLGQDKAQMYEVVDWTTAELERVAPERPAPPARDRRRRRPDRAASSSGSTRSTARCRRGWAATAWRSCPTPRRAGASTWSRRAGATAPEPILDGCPCPACARRLLARLPALPAARRRADRRCGCVTLHNLRSSRG